MLMFLKSVAHTVREKQDKMSNANSTLARFPQIFYQVHILTTGIIDDIDDVLKAFECSQWACLPIQINFINIYQKNI